jgi:hypothetical protein
MSMADWFVALEFVTDATTMADDAVDRLQVLWPGWVPNPGDPEVIQIETIAPMVQDVGEAAVLVPPAIFRAYGTKLIGREYQAGQSAFTTLTFNLTDTEGHRIPAATEVDIDGFSFTVDEDIFVPVGSDSATGVSASSSDQSSAANDLVGDSVSLITELSFVSDVVVETPTANGADAEDDEEYQNALSGDLKLQAKTLVTTADFEIWALSYPGIGRALAVHTGDRAVDLTIVDENGANVPTALKDQLDADLDEWRLVNTVLTVNDPTRTTINVTYTVKALPGYDPGDLQLRINAMLTDLLSPANWGTPKAGELGSTPTWINEPIVRTNILIDRIADVEGVDYVDTISITGSAGSSVAAGWQMAGTYALAQAGTLTGTIE